MKRHPLKVPYMAIIKEDEKKFWVVLGNQKLHEQPFPTLNYAKTAYLKKDWELIMNAICAMFNLINKRNNETNGETQENH